MYVNSLADAGGILKLLDTSPSTCQHTQALVSLLRNATQPLDGLTNPQGRRLVNMQECLAVDQEEEGHQADWDTQQVVKNDTAGMA